MSSTTKGSQVRRSAWVRQLKSLSLGDIPSVGGKNASLGELLSTLGAEGIAVPDGFATTAEAYWDFLRENGLREPIERHLNRIEADPNQLQAEGHAIRERILAARLPASLVDSVRAAYQDLERESGAAALPVAARSSATAEDLPEASFAGQHDTFLNVRGPDALLEAVLKCYASLFTDRAISYRNEHGFAHMQVALSVGVQRMVGAGDSGAGVMFTIDTESGFQNAAVIDAAWGLGETVVGGVVDPDEYTVFKPLLARPELRPILSKRLGSKRIKTCLTDSADEPVREQETTPQEQAAWVLTDEEILQLARWGVVIERHYGCPMDIEWCKDAESAQVFVLQARPETVQSRRGARLEVQSLGQRSEVLLRGTAIGGAIGAGRVRVLDDPQRADEFRAGEVLVAARTDPDWGPIMERASAIVTDHGGRTAHAAIVAREFGIPAVVGTGTGTQVLRDGQEVTVSCAEASGGVVFDGELEIRTQALDLSAVPELRTKLMMNIASPAAALRWHRVPCRGIGLARMEFIISGAIEVHPMALIRFEELQDGAARQRIEELTAGYADKCEYFIDRLCQGIATIAASRYPDPVIVRTSDFKSNEYAQLVGGAQFEPAEPNPMLGMRGAARYTRDIYREGFLLECRALKRVRERMGLDNVVVMLPFCRTLEEADRVLEIMASEGLERGVEGLEIYVMAEIPSNVLLAEQFAERFDGFSIGTNDLTQLILGVDRDSAALADLFDEQNEAVKAMIRDLIERAHAQGRPVGLCGQAPSDHPEFAEFLVEAGIDSISLNPDSVLEVTRHVERIEQRAHQAGAGGPEA